GNGDHGPGRWPDGSRLGSLWGISRGAVQWIGRSDVRPEAARVAPSSGVDPRQSADAKDAVRSGDCDRDAVVLLFKLGMSMQERLLDERRFNRWPVNPH